MPINIQQVIIEKLCSVLKETQVRFVQNSTDQRPDRTGDVEVSVRSHVYICKK